MRVIAHVCAYMYVRITHLNRQLQVALRSSVVRVRVIHENVPLAMNLMVLAAAINAGHIEGACANHYLLLQRRSGGIHHRDLDDALLDLCLVELAQIEYEQFVEYAAADGVVGRCVLLLIETFYSHDRI